MTNTAPDDPVNPTAGRQSGRADELEDWLTDIRVTLGDDPPDWLTPEDDVADPDGEPAPAPPAARHHLTDNGVPTRSARSDGEPAIGRHRAAD